MGVAGSQSAELDEGLVDAEVVGRARPGGGRGAAVRIDLEIGTQQAVVGLRSRIEPDARLRRERSAIVVAREARNIAAMAERTVVGTDLAADLEAGIAAGNVEEARTEGRADLHIFDGFALGHGQIGSLGRSRGCKSGDGAKEYLLERHVYLLRKFAKRGVQGTGGFASELRETWGRVDPQNFRSSGAPCSTLTKYRSTRQPIPTKTGRFIGHSLIVVAKRTRL
ncbi:hypothetical protein LMIY3S_00325 [Labrys miyagiensis]